MGSNTPSAVLGSKCRWAQSGAAAQYKAALQGYRRFLDLPKSIDSELTIELPDGGPENCH